MHAMLDVETTMIEDGEIPETLFWGLATEDGVYRTFKTTAKLAKFMKQTPALRVLHHTNFDVLQLLIDGVEDIKINRSHNGRLIMSRWGEHLLLNSYSMFPCKMEEILAAFGHVKTGLENLKQRNYEDCVLGLKAIIDFDKLCLDTIGQSPLLRHTMASTAFHACEEYAGKLPKDLRHEAAYRGGKVEVYDLNVWIADDWDINSSYPASFVDAPEMSELLYCKVRTKDWYGPLFDAQNMDRLCFPNGVFNTYVFRDVWERYIRPYADDTRLDVISAEPISLKWLRDCIPLIMKLYLVKQNAPDGGALRMVCKLMINAVYGRIGLRGERERCRILDYYPDGDDITVYQFGRSKYICWDKIEIEPKSNFPLAAYITDNGRGRLYAASKQTSALYCDTDSVFTTNNRAPTPQGNAIGQWKHIGKGSGIFQGRNVKDYYWGGTTEQYRKVKGGTAKTQWTMKRWASGKQAELVCRNFSDVLYKRSRHQNGQTEPLIVKY